MTTSYSTSDTPLNPHDLEKRGINPLLPPRVSDICDPHAWAEILPTSTGITSSDITYHRGVTRNNHDEIIRLEPYVRIAFNRPHVRNAFRPETVDALYRALDHARLCTDVAAIILTGNGPSPKDGGWAFCSGGDQRVRGKDGYQYSDESGNFGLGRLHILEVQRLIRSIPKPVIAAIPGWATGGGHSLEVVCDLAIASKEHARFMQVDANVASFDAGYGSQLLARQVGDRRAREIFFLAEPYSAEQAEAWGAINKAVPHEKLEETAITYAQTIATKSPQAIRMLKFAFNALDDGIAGMQAFAGEATRLAYMSEEAREGRDAFLEHRAPRWDSFPYYA